MRTQPLLWAYAFDVVPADLGEYSISHVARHGIIPVGLSEAVGWGDSGKGVTRPSRSVGCLRGLTDSGNDAPQCADSKFGTSVSARPTRLVA